MDLPEDTLYAYSPMSDPDETRVLHLSAGHRDEALCGRLESVHLDDSPSFEALSYEWGNPALTRIIHLQDGSSVRITESLYSALSDLRREDRDRIIWADGVCVNQADISERGRQVALMGSIYRRAERVVTYIGPERDNSSLAIDFAKSDFESPHSSDKHRPSLPPVGKNALLGGGSSPVRISRRVGAGVLKSSY